MTSLINGGLSQEVERISTAIRTEPLDPSHRLALAQLRLVQGEYPKALQQLQLGCQFDAELEPEAQLIKILVTAEQTREAVFAGKILPDLLAEPPPWLEKLIQALREPDEKAAELRQEALSEAPESKGTYGESSGFESIADGDERLGPVLEIILGGTYYWVPFDAVESLGIPVPHRAMDLVWAPVELKLVGQPARIAYIPARYVLPAGEELTDTLLTGTETIWRETAEGLWYGLGRRVWYVDGETLGIFEAGKLSFEHELPEVTPESPESPE
jgi:type VI secretion system protein ImpE